MTLSPFGRFSSLPEHPSFDFLRLNMTSRHEEIFLGLDLGISYREKRRRPATFSRGLFGQRKEKKEKKVYNSLKTFQIKISSRRSSALLTVEEGFYTGGFLFISLRKAISVKSMGE